MAKICFIVGHGKSKTGGYDSGAVSKDGKYHEFKIAKEIAKYAQQYYNANYSEQCDLMNYDGSIYLSDRIKKANAGNYDFVAEFHLNAGGGTGTECFYSKGSTKGMCYAEKISAAISAAFDVRNRGSKTKTNSSGKDYFGIIRQTEAEAVLIETLFIDTNYDINKINTAEGQQKCGEAIAKAVAAVRGAKKKSVVSTTATVEPTVKPTSTPTATSTLKVNDIVKIASNAKYYGTNTDVPDWVKKINWIVSSVNGSRVVLGKSADGKNNINSPVDSQYLTRVTVEKPAKSYYPKYTGKSTRIDDVFKAIGVSSTYRGSWSKRKPVATANGISGYVGSAVQNTKLISLAKQGLLVKP